MSNIYGPALPPIQGPKDPKVLAREVRIAKELAHEADLRALRAWGPKEGPDMTPFVAPPERRWVTSWVDTRFTGAHICW